MKPRKGFTLIELLTVISIIAILMAILMPVFVAAKQAVHRYQAANQLKQLGMVVMMYAADNNELLPAYRFAGAWGEHCPPAMCLNPDFRHDLENHGDVAKEWYGAKSRDSVFFSQLVESYVKNGSIFRSPGQPSAWVGADKTGVSAHDPDHRSYGAQNSYALNWYLFSSPIGYSSTGGGIPISAISRTSETLLMVDGGFYLALPRHPAILAGNPYDTEIVCSGSYPHYWKNIGNSSYFGQGAPISDEEALRNGPTRFGGMMVQLSVDGSTKMKTYTTVIGDLRSKKADSVWDPYKQGFYDCAVN